MADDPQERARKARWAVRTLERLSDEADRTEFGAIDLRVAGDESEYPASDSILKDEAEALCEAARLGIAMAALGVDLYER